MTEKAGSLRLYYEDSYLTEFEASVIEETEDQGQPGVILDRTAFYPLSGGQPWDTGVLDGTAVLRVIERDGDIVHVLEKKKGPGKVRGRIDWPRRFDHMQQHTGQHILSQAFYELLQGETRSFHLGPEISTLEIGLASISETDLKHVEKRANEIVWQDRVVKSYFVPEEKIETIPLRRPPKKHGLLRIIEVEGYDYSACGGTHCRRSAEIGLIKIISAEKIRGNVRFEFVCGGRALADYSSKNSEIKKIAGMFSASAAGVSGAVEKLAAGSKLLKKRIKELGERLVSFEAADILKEAEGGVVARVLEGRTPEEARLLAVNTARLGQVCAVFGIMTETQGHLICAGHESLKVNLLELAEYLKTLMPVKGGGGPTLVTLVLDDRNDTRPAVEAAAAWFKGRGSL